MKMEEISQLSLDEIKMRLEDSLEEYDNLKFQHAMRQLDNPLRLRAVRRDIARLRTVLHEYELGMRTSQKAEE